MSKSTYSALVDIDDDDTLNTAQSQLEFQIAPSVFQQAQQQTTNNTSTSAFWTIEFYAQFFDVNSSDVAQRIIAALIPKGSFMDKISPNPDLYVTVLSFASTVVFSYILGMVGALWGLSRSFGCPIKSLEIAGLIGYGMSIWVPVSMKGFGTGDVALITGGGSGIGLALAKRCYSVGMKVLIVDIDAQKLEAARESIGVNRTTVFAMDVGQKGDWIRLRKLVEKDYGRLDFLALNAGISPSGTFNDVEYFHAMFAVNFYGVVNGVAAFLSLVKASASKKTTRIVITGSKQGITNPPGNPAYNASKAAIRSYAEGLSFELRNTPVSVTLLVPGWTYTGLSPGSSEGKPKPDGAWTADQVAGFLDSALEQDARRFYVVCPDNEVDELLDKKRMLWNIGDIVHNRQPLNRWREDSKDAAAKGVNEISF
ncbi:hypothetical protein HK100_004315 [Physocladia obscura]|uniref:Uncharacterized protein n=1 Tax=Physocladia obscura TaxID=109957 RepID=A0AAD5XD23_9FUNG|nr:hypothetical protein HK100_004315 [Physocladia obscura]